MIPASLPTIVGPFRLEAVLGEGGSGIVYDATWGPRRVALKVLHPSLVGTQRVRAQFLVEAQRLQAIAHPSVVKVLAVGELPDGRPFLAMERLVGETLASVLARGALPLAHALDLFGELASAVGTLHEQQLVHRDLKPENVFIVDGKHAVLLDFGIAKDLTAPASTTTMDGGVRGTPAYMAPERFFGQAAGVATDVYELAVILYAMLAGRLPWDDLADPEGRLSPRPLVELADVPAELDVEIRRALSTRAQNRPATATALLEAVQIAAGREADRQAEREPAPASTARMKPQTDGGALKPTVTADKKPWFAERQNTTDRGKTPLAWAPTQPAPAPARPPRQRSKARWIAGASAVALLAGGVAWWRLRDDTPTPTAPVAAATVAVDATPKVAAANDPWGDGARQLEPTLVPEVTASGPAVSIATAQTELVKAIPHLPADTSFIIAAQVGHLRRDERFESMFTKLAKHPKVSMVMGMVPPCMKALIADSEWFAFGSTGFMASEQGTLIVRGRWGRSEVEKCFMGQYETLAMTDGTEMMQLPNIGWIDFLDEHTAYISVRQDLAAAQVHTNVKQAKGLTKHTRTLLATLPADRTLTFVVDGTGGVEWPGDPLPRGSDAAMWLRTTEQGLSLDLAMDTKSAAEAKKLETTLNTTFKGLFDAASPSVAKLQILRTQTRVRVVGDLSTLMIGIVSSALQQ